MGSRVSNQETPPTSLRDAGPMQSSASDLRGGVMAVLALLCLGAITMVTTQPHWRLLSGRGSASSSKHGTYADRRQVYWHREPGSRSFVPLTWCCVLLGSDSSARHTGNTSSATNGSWAVREWLEIRFQFLCLASGLRPPSAPSAQRWIFPHQCGLKHIARLLRPDTKRQC